MFKNSTLCNRFSIFNTYSKTNIMLHYLIGNGSSSIKEYTALEVSNDLGIIIPEDHIIEESTSGTWEIRQRASGKVEVMGKALNVENNTITQWGSIYYATSAIQLPQILQNAAIKNIQITSASAILFFVL